MPPAFTHNRIRDATASRTTPAGICYVLLIDKPHGIHRQRRLKRSVLRASHQYAGPCAQTTWRADSDDGNVT